MTLSHSRKDFPEDFLFGVSTSAYQIEGHQFGGAGSTHWDTFAATPGNVVNAEDGAVACDHYHRWPEDLDLIRDGNFDVYRFSASWARVLPEGLGARIDLASWELPPVFRWLAETGGMAQAELLWEWLQAYHLIILVKL
mgnify:CR=1 FL=1